MIYTLFDYADRTAGEQKATFFDLPYLHKITGILEDCVAGALPDGKRNLAITIAPRSYKTSFASRYFPAWCLAEVSPDCEFILTSYSEGLAVGNAMAISKYIGAEWHQDLYPHLRVDRKSRDVQNHFTTTTGGAVYAVGTGGTITGMGAGKTRGGFGGAIIIDDPLKAQDARSVKERENCINFYSSVLKNRKNNALATPIILVQQRLHVDDLVGWVMKNEAKDWALVSFPAIIDGKLLNPVTMSMEDLANLKEVDPVTYWAQYMQTPIVPGGSMIKLNWWRTYNQQTEFPRGGYVFITADTAFKSKADSDQSVIQCWCANRDGLYLLDAVYGRWEFPQLLEQAHKFWDKWRVRGVREFFVEDKASGTPLAQTMEMNGLPAEAWRPQEFDFASDKVGRVSDSAFLVHSGRVFLPEGRTTVRIDNEHSMKLELFAAELAEQAALFQRDMGHAHDDHVDAFTMACSVYKSML